MNNIIINYVTISLWHWKKLITYPIVVKRSEQKRLIDLLDAKYFGRMKILIEPFYNFENLYEPITEDDFNH